METFGRERRHRYYTAAAFRALVAREGLDDSAATYANIDHSTIGGFASTSSSVFYEDEKTLISYADSFKDKLNAGNRRHKLKNPIMPDGSVKIGRPRKTPASGVKEGTGKHTAAVAAKANCKRKREEGDQEDADNQEVNGETPVKRKRGRPPKKPRLDADAGVEGIDQIVTQGVGEQGKAELVSPKKRARLTKQKPSDTTQEAGGPLADQPANSEEVVTSQKKRGRPFKQKPEIIDTRADGTQQTNGEDGGASEDAPPKKRGRPAKQRQTSPPHIVDSNQPSTQTSNNDAKSIIPPTVLGASPELGNASVGNNIAGSSHIQPEEARRSPRNRSAIFHENNSFSKQQTLPKIPVVPKATKMASDAINEPVSVGNRGGSMLLVEVSQDRDVNLTVGQVPQSSQSHSAAPSSSFTMASVPSMEAEVHRDVPELNVGVNSTATYRVNPLIDRRILRHS
jgi:hypothetical protein